VGPILHPLATLTLPLPSPERLFIGLIEDVILPRGSIFDDAVPEQTVPFIFREFVFLLVVRVKKLLKLFHLCFVFFKGREKNKKKEKEKKGHKKFSQNYSQLVVPAKNKSPIFLYVAFCYIAYSNYFSA